MESTVQWVIGGLTTIIGGITAFLGTTMFRHHKDVMDLHNSLDKRLVIIESRPHVDPIEYIKAMAQLTAAMTNQTSEIARLRNEIEGLKQTLKGRVP